jgi:hypothetical protein
MARITSPTKKATWRRAAPFAGAAAVIGVIVVVFVSAAGSPIAFEAESGNLAGSAVLATVTGQSGTGAVKFVGSATPTPAPGGTLLGWQLTPHNIGLEPFGLTCASLPEQSDSAWPGHTVPAGTTISRKRITTWLDLSQGNITIDQSCIQPQPGNVGIGTEALTTWNGNRALQGPVTIKDSEYDGSLLSDHDAAWIGFMVGAMSIYRTYVHHSGSGFNTYGSYEKTGANIVIENNYVDDLIAYGDPTNGGNHESAYTVRDLDTSTNPNRQLIIRGNHFNCDGANSTGALFMQPNSGSISNVTIQDNYLLGFGFLLYMDYDTGRFPGVGYTGYMKSINNRFNPSEGLVFVRPGSGGFTQWSENYLYNASAQDGKGAVVTNPS